ncbi:divergent PAP2 family protein [Deinococcus cellulosilyticus]|uniref:Membrane protein n=1 Tax=Deinococcus cellulosilyticus (strain DSM 18568 / NBRC 106333 / KACC 11606 / 5516J-15) TaxID=1223518 RepID=A0A511MZL7_DEIC1|nr:divergent PAP2 family protein [Deinococcus cellulosilyticus]GEM46070.1 membrane protein [Deinococcus cellulosilyticus NBRC 106333 = KACC 11606]
MQELLNNLWLWTGFAAAIIAQLIKVLLALILEKRWRPGLFMETGGMPSSHTALVAALCTGIGYTHGVGSPIFAVAVVFSSIVMYDATGVRRSAGMQARLLNELMVEIRELVREGFAPQPLRVLLGHTYLEVAIGLLLGILIGYTSFQLFYVSGP